MEDQEKAYRPDGFVPRGEMERDNGIPHSSLCGLKGGGGGFCLMSGNTQELR